MMTRPKRLKKWTMKMLFLTQPQGRTILVFLHKTILSSLSNFAYDLSKISPMFH